MDVIKLVMAGLVIALSALSLPRTMANALSAQADLVEGPIRAETLLNAARFAPLDGELYRDAYWSFWNSGQREAALGSLDRILAVEPGNSQNWLLRAATFRAVTLEMEDVTASLEMSLLTGRYDPREQVARLALGLHLWRNLSDDMRDAFREQVGAIWTVRRLQRDLADLYLKQLPVLQDVILDALPQSRSQQERFARLVEERRA